MTFSPEQIKQLSAPLNAAHVATRTQSGRTLSYVEGWHVIMEANRIFGFDGWHSEVVDLRLVAERERTMGRDGSKKGWGVSYVAKVRVTVFAGDQLVIREGIGTGHGIDADLGAAHESAVKEAETDSRKRALMTFGNPFGLALYDKAQSNVDHGGQANHAAMNPGEHDPGGDVDRERLAKEWADKQAIEIDACVKASDIDRLKLWRTKNDAAIQRLCRNHEAIGDKLMRLFDDAYSDLAAALRQAG